MKSGLTVTAFDDLAAVDKAYLIEYWRAVDRMAAYEELERSLEVNASAQRKR